MIERNTLNSEGRHMETCAGVDMELSMPLIACLSDPEGHDGINGREGCVCLVGKSLLLCVKFGGC